MHASTLEVTPAGTLRRVRDEAPTPQPPAKSAVIVGTTSVESDTESFALYLNGSQQSAGIYATLPIAIANANARCDGPIRILP